MQYYSPLLRYFVVVVVIAQFVCVFVVMTIAYRRWRVRRTKQERKGTVFAITITSTIRYKIY